MGIRDTLQRWFPPDSGDYVARNMPGYLQQRDALGSMPMAYQIGRPQYPTRSAAVYDEQAYRKIALVFRCINVIANAVGSAPIRVYDRGKDQQLSEIPDHPMRKLLERPNPTMGETVFFATISTTMAATGFCVIEKERAGAGRPVGLWPLRSDWLSPIPRSDGKADWHYKIPGRSPVTIMAEDVIVLTYASRPDYGLTGIGALEVALAQWSLLGTMDDFLKAFFDGGGQFSYGLLLADGATLKQDEADLLKKQWTSRFSSWRHGYIEPPILQTVKGIQRLGATFAEMEYVTMRDISEIAILQAFGVPGSLVGQRFAQERNTFTNYGEARTSFYQDTIIPLWARLDDAFTRQLLPEFDVRPSISLQFDTSDVDALQEDQTALWTRAQAAMTAGGITRNEFRQEIGLPAVPNGDVFLLPFNVTEMPLSVQKAPVRASVFVHEPRAIAPGDRRARGLVALSTRSAIETRAHRVYTNAARKFTEPLQAFFDGQRDRVIGHAQRSTRAIADLTAIDWPAEDEALDAIIRQLWDLMGNTATEQANELLGLSTELQWTISNPWVREVLGEVATRVTDINETTKRDIAKVVGDALTEGTSIPDLSDRLSSLFDETYAGRAQTIARTESMTAYSHASLRGFQESGLVNEVEILDNPQHDTDPGPDGYTCAGRNGLIVSIEQAYVHIAAEHPNGSAAVSPVLATPLGTV
jgi:HK97 family phage portal protein